MIREAAARPPAQNERPLRAAHEKNAWAEGKVAGLSLLANRRRARRVSISPQ